MRIMKGTALLGSLFLLASMSSARAIDTNIRNYACERLDDFTADIVIEKSDQRELRKISKDFGLAYRFHKAHMQYKEPNMALIEGSSQGTKIGFLVNGTRQVVTLNGRKLSDSDLGKSPGKRKSLIDVGLVSDFYLTYTNARFMREGTVDGTPCGVFDMTYKDRAEDTSHHVLYIDPKTRVVRKRESYSQDGKLQAIYFYQDVKQVKPNVWVPTKVEVQNADRVIAGVTAYEGIRVNTGIPDSVFHR